MAALVYPLTAQESDPSIRFSGEAKTGIYWTQQQYEGKDPTSEIKIHNNDDSGSNQGRFRVNLDYDNGNSRGFRVRIDWHQWGDPYPDRWSYAFGYGNFFQDQLAVSVGKLGASPWGTGGPEMWKELEWTEKQGGMRVEWKPSFLPEGHKINTGFVLNYFNTDLDQGNPKAAEEVTLLEILKESTVGIAYTNPLGHVRFAYRFDSDMDANQANKAGADVGFGEDEIVYRVEEHVLRNILPGLEIWALGHFMGVSAVNDEIKNYRNWFFIQYAPEMFTAQIRLGYDYIKDRSELSIKPSFYWNFFDKLISIGAAYMYKQDFGNRVWEGSPYLEMQVEPMVRINWASSYIAFVYNWKQEYMGQTWAEAGNKDPIMQTQFMNLRFVIYF